MKSIFEMISSNTPDIHNIGNLCQAVLFSKLENQKLIKGLIRAASFSHQSLPMQYYLQFKQLRYIAGALYPDLNYTHFDVRCYHNEQVINILKNVEDDHRE